MDQTPWLKLPIKALRLVEKKKLKNWFIYKFILFLITFLNLFPRKLTLLLGASLGRLVYLIFPESRKITLQNLKIAFPQLKISPYKKLALKVFESLGRNAVDAARLPKMNLGKIQKMVKPEGMEHFEKAYSLGKGVMAVTGHIGNFELLAAYFSLSGYKVSVIGRELYDPRLDELLVTNRQKMRMQNIYSTSGVKEVIKALNSGRVLGVLIDQDTSRVRGIFVNFFGRKALTPVGPVILALKFNSPILPMAIIQNRKGEYKIIIREEIKPLTEKTREENIHYLTQKCTDFLEEVIRKYPDQWVWMHKRWLRSPDSS